jgi:thiol-disulfide isomerase/thioredoxin
VTGGPPRGPAVRGPAVRALAALAAGLLLASCTTDQPAKDPNADTQVAQSRVDVDTPALRALKARAGVQTCAPGDADNQLPQVTLPCLGGGPDVDLAGLRGPMVINLFAQWCGPCRGELPYFQRLHEQAEGTLRVLGVDYLDTQPRQALELVRDTGVTYPLLADPDGDLRPELRIRGLPGVVLLDADGEVADVEFRVFRSYADLRTFVEQGLGVTVPA